MLHRWNSWRRVGAAAAACATQIACAADLALISPSVIDASRPFTLTASSPAAPVRIDGFPGDVSGLLLYSIDAGKPSLRPPTWRALPGQRIAFELRNRLPCIDDAGISPGQHMRPSQTNVHVHGLIVSPHEKDATGRYGDNTMLVVDSQGPGCEAAAAGHAGSMAGMPHEPGGKARYRIRLPHDHPYGLSWYHPHVHQVAGLQVGAGMSGLIEIGSVWQYAYAKYSTRASVGDRDEQVGRDTRRRREELALRRSTREHVLMLKDLQVTPGPEGAGHYKRLSPLNTTLCGAAAAPAGLCADPASGAQWLFMVNGQVFPTIDIRRGERHVWRMANVGATVSYKLRLRVTLPEAAKDRIIPVQVLVSDGVALEQAKARAHWQDSVTMMPSARAEVFVDPMVVCRVVNGRAPGDRAPCTMADDVEAVLESSGIRTGADAWPDAGLAKVRVRSIVRYAKADDPGPMGVSTVRLAAAGSPQEAARPAEGPCPNPTRIGPTQYRLIGLRNAAGADGEVFGMATRGTPGVLDAAGRPTVTTLSEADYQPFDAGRVDLCIGADIARGYKERWVIKNDAAEIHNFHLHQAKFKVLDYDDSVPLLVPMRTGRNVQHDNFPINPGQWILIEVSFDRPEQVGKYMYHCHILEHEDKGMMSVIQVVDMSAQPAGR